jgi:signal transduction histidine kinase
LDLFRLRQFRIINDYKGGLTYANNLLSKNGQSNLKYEVLIEKSILHYYIGEYESTISICYGLLKKSDLKKEVRVKSYSMLANSHWKLGNGIYAEKYFKRCYQGAKEINDSSLMSISLNGLGLIDYSEGTKESMKDAVVLFNRAASVSPKSKLTLLLSADNNLAAVYYQLKDYKEASRIFKQCLDLAVQIGDTSTMIISLNNLGSIAMIQKDLNAAKTYLDRSYEIHKQYNPGEAAPAELLLSLSDLHYALGDYKQSRDYFERYSTSSLELLNAERNQAMIEMQEEYDALNKKKEITDLKLSAQRSELSYLKLQNLIAFIIISFIIMLIILGILIYRKRRQDKKERMLELQRASLEAAENEKLRISRELHDSMGGTFTVLSLLLGQEQSNDPENEILIRMREMIDNGTKDLRQICRDIFPQNLKLSGLHNSLHDLFGHLNERQNQVRFQIDFEDHDFAPGFSINFYRIVQELANNTLKYSGGDNALLVGSMISENIFRVDYSDNGVGIDDKNLKVGVGLNSIMERAKSYSGKITFDKVKVSNPGFYLSIEFQSNVIFDSVVS